MINDVQTHDLPMSLAGLERVALFMGINKGLDLKREIEFNLESS